MTSSLSATAKRLMLGGMQPRRRSLASTMTYARCSRGLLSAVGGTPDALAGWSSGDGDWVWSSCGGARTRAWFRDGRYFLLRIGQRVSSWELFITKL